MPPLSSSKRLAPWAFILAFFLIWSIRLGIYRIFDSDIQNPFLKRIVSDGWRALVWLILPILWLIFVERRGIVTAIRPNSVRSLRWAGLAGGALCALIVISYRLTFGHWTGIPLDRSWNTYAAILPSILLVGIAEEFIFRGVFLSGLLRGGWGPWRANFIAAVFFALSHWPGWLAGQGSMGPLSFLTASIRLVIFGMAMSGLVTLEGGIVVAILVHSFNDLWVGLFFY
jgi:membrane protease YdiL (CAAX protease family)